MGFAVAAPGDAADYAALLHLAAEALRDAKEGGRDAYVIRPVTAHSNP
jgi:PleD family two-component response regulator